jgi:hypothetical protein
VAFGLSRFIFGALAVLAVGQIQGCFTGECARQRFGGSDRSDGLDRSDRSFVERIAGARDVIFERSFHGVPSGGNHSSEAPLKPNPPSTWSLSATGNWSRVNTSPNRHSMTG